MNRRLYRCRENRMLAGVASGVAEYLGVDPSFVRLVWFASIFFGGLGFLLYIAMIFIVPLEPLTAEAAAAHAAVGGGAPLGHLHRPGSGWLMTTFGVVLLLIGAVALLQIVLPGWATWRQIWPLLFLGAGGFLLLRSMRREAASPDQAHAAARGSSAPAYGVAPTATADLAVQGSTPAPADPAEAVASVDDDEATLA